MRNILFCIIILFTSLAISCSNIYRVTEVYDYIRYNEDIQVSNHHLQFLKGNTVLISYGIHTSVRARRGRVHDGGSSDTIYISIPLPYRLKNGKYSLQNKYIKAAFVEIRDPGGYDVYDSSQLKGHITILGYEKNNYLKIKIFMKKVMNGKEYLVFDKIHTYKNIRF